MVREENTADNVSTGFLRERLRRLRQRAANVPNEPWVGALLNHLKTPSHPCTEFPCLLRELKLVERGPGFEPA